MEEFFLFYFPLGFTAVLMVCLIIDIATDGRFITWLFQGRI